MAVAEALAADDDPPEVVEAEAAAVEATAALSCASPSEFGEEEREGGARLAPAGRKGVSPLPTPLSKGFSQSSRLVATSVILCCCFFFWKERR